MTQPKAADDYAAINAHLNRIQAEKQEALAGEMPVVQPMYGGLDPALAEGATELDLVYWAAEKDGAPLRSFRNGNCGWMVRG